MRLRLTPILAALALLALAPLAHAGGAPRIVGGSDVAAGAYPFMAALIVPGIPNDADAQTCGGTVIAPYAILTAAHCVVDRPTGLVVVTGKSDLAAAGGQHLAVRTMITHPTFDNADPFPGDIAVVLLAAPTSAPAIARSTSTPTSGNATATGWGATNNAGTAFPSALKQATLAIQPAGDCGPLFPICAGLTSPNICIGDSGGPLFTTPGGVPLQLGIASAVLAISADPCGGDSSMFTDVSLYNSWIDAQLVPAVSGVAVSSVAGKLHVTWQRTPGGAEPAVVVTTSDGTFRSAPTGATSLDIAGLPLRAALSATVTVTNTWGTASASSAGTATLVGAPGVTGVAATAKKVTGSVATNGVATTVTAQYGPDATHLTTTAALHLADAAGATSVAIPVGALAAGRTYRARLVAENSAGKTISGWATFTIPATKPVSTTRPKMTGSPKVGKTLTCGAGKWKAAPAPTFAYGWRIGGKVSKTQKKSKLKLTDAMLGKSVSCIVTAKNPAAAVAARSVAVTVRHR